MSILITGGAGFIGSHTCVEMLNSGYDVVVVDNLDNSSSESLDRVEKITGKKVKFYKEDVRNREALRKIFTENSIEAVIHFAGLKAVGESVREPIMYYDNNLINTLVLLETMNEFGVKKIVFSSSATVYGVATEMPLVEGMPLGAINPYGRTKLFIEHILTDIYAADKDWCVALLRYFNPIGAHKSLSARILKEFRTISCLIFRRLQSVSLISFMFSEMIIKRLMAQACVIISMLWIWRSAMSRQSNGCLKTPAASRLTSAPATERAFCSCATHLLRQQALKYLML